MCQELFFIVFHEFGPLGMVPATSIVNLKSGGFIASFYTVSFHTITMGMKYSDVPTRKPRSFRLLELSSRQ